MDPFVEFGVAADGTPTIELVDNAGDSLILTQGLDSAMRRALGRPHPRLEATLGCVEDDECVDLSVLHVEALRDFLDGWLEGVRS